MYIPSRYKVLGLQVLMGKSCTECHNLSQVRPPVSVTWFSVVSKRTLALIHCLALREIVYSCVNPSLSPVSGAPLLLLEHKSRKRLDRDPGMLSLLSQSALAVETGSDLSDMHLLALCKKRILPLMLSCHVSVSFFFFFVRLLRWRGFINVCMPSFHCQPDNE